MSDTRKFVEINLPVPVAAFWDAARKARAAALNEELATINAERRTLAERLTAYADGSAIDPEAFTDIETIMEDVADLRRARLAVPSRGLLHVRNVEVFRDECQPVFGEHAAARQAALADGAAKARTRADAMRLSPRLTEAYIAEETTDLRTAAAAPNPTPGDSWEWNAAACHRARFTLLAEFRDGVRASV